MKRGHIEDNADRSALELCSIENIKTSNRSVLNRLKEGKKKKSEGRTETKVNRWIMEEFEKEIRKSRLGKDSSSIFLSYLAHSATRRSLSLCGRSHESATRRASKPFSFFDSFLQALFIQRLTKTTTASPLHFSSSLHTLFRIFSPLFYSSLPPKRNSNPFPVGSELKLKPTHRDVSSSPPSFLPSLVLLSQLARMTSFLRRKTILALVAISVVIYFSFRGGGASSSPPPYVSFVSFLPLLFALPSLPPPTHCFFFFVSNERSARFDSPPLPPYRTPTSPSKRPDTTSSRTSTSRKGSCTWSSRIPTTPTSLLSDR